MGSCSLKWNVSALYDERLTMLTSSLGRFDVGKGNAAVGNGIPVDVPLVG